jgi:hypothetical protein
MQAGSTRSVSPALIAGVAGGVVIAIGSFLTWGTVALDVNGFIARLADALGVDPNQIPIPAGTFGATSRSVSGLDTSDGKITLVAGIVVILASLALMSPQLPRKLMAALMVLGGAGGAGVALYDISKKDDLATDVLSAVKSIAGAGLQQAGLDVSILDTVIKVSLGIGIYLCVIGGAVAVVAGLMALLSRPTVAPAASGWTAGAPTDAGFGTPSPPAAPASPTLPPPAPAPAGDDPPPPEAPTIGGPVPPPS